MATPSSTAPHQLCIAIICYYAEPRQLHSLLSSVHSQAAQLLVVDNSAADLSVQQVTEPITQPFPNCLYLPQTENLGVARGYNLAAEWAQQHHFSHILLLDQDSLPDHDMVERLLSAEATLTGQGVRIATVAPRYSDGRDKDIHSTFRRFNGFAVKRFSCHSTRNQPPLIEVDQAISSGSLISLPALAQIGPMDEAFFIDLVDTEWVLRARSMGYLSYGVCDAHMRHQIGDRFIHLPIIGRNIAIHSPLRLYYLVRNTIFLYKKPYTPRRWALLDGVNLVVKIGVSFIMADHRWSQLRRVWEGVRDGLSGRGGIHSETKRADTKK